MRDLLLLAAVGNTPEWAAWAFTIGASVLDIIEAVGQFLLPFAIIKYLFFSGERSRWRAQLDD